MTLIEAVPNISEGRDPSVIQAEIGAFKAKLKQVADLQSFGQKKKEAEKPEEETKTKLVKKAKKIKRTMTERKDRDLDAADDMKESDILSQSVVETEEATDDKM